MEEPVEKTSYTLSQRESDLNKPESFALLEEDIPMLEKSNGDEKLKGKSTEILAEPNENTALTDEKKETIKEEKDVTQTNLPTKNRFLRLFDKKTNKNEPTEQNGNGLNQPEEEGVPTAPKRRFIPALKIQNPFGSKKNDSAAPEALVEAEKEKGKISEDESPLVEGEEKKGKMTSIIFVKGENTGKYFFFSSSRT